MLIGEKQISVRVFLDIAKTWGGLAGWGFIVRTGFATFRIDRWAGSRGVTCPPVPLVRLDAAPVEVGESGRYPRSKGFASCVFVCRLSAPDAQVKVNTSSGGY